jgi:hypothetical protein
MLAPPRRAVDHMQLTASAVLLFRLRRAQVHER